MEHQIKLFLFISFLFIPACQIMSPESVVKDYFTFIQEGKYDNAYNLLTEFDKTEKPLNEFKEEMQYIALFGSKWNYNIISSATRENIAKVIIKTEYPDLSGLMSELFGRAFENILNDEKMGKEDYLDLLKSKLQEKDFPTAKEEQTITLIKEESTWRILNFYYKSHLIDKANEYIKNKDFRAANETYKEGLKIDPYDKELKLKRKELRASYANWKIKKNYIDSIEIFDEKGKMYNVGFWEEELIPGVEFGLRNNGNKTLKKVEVTAYFMNQENKTIHEKTFTPVNYLTGEYAYMNGENYPLRPNYIWNLERDHYLKCKRCPKEWKIGNVKFVITDIEFLD